nr:hypothetical protein [Trichoderma harzianum]
MMADFDPSKPIDDPQVWFPKGMFIENKAQQSTIKLYAANDEDKTFILNHDKMVAFNFRTCYHEADNQYNEEKDKPDPDQKTVEDLASAVKDLKEIEDLQTHTDRDFQKIESSTYYVSVPFVGAIATAMVTLIAKADIKRLKAAMEGIQELLDANEEKLQTAYRLQGDISSMETRLTGFVNVMKPAIATLEALQGAWAEMNTDLQTLYDLFEDDKQSIPPMLLEKRQLETIVDAWNNLKAYANDYIEHAFMTDDPEQVTIQYYVKQLDNAVQ